MSTKSWKSNQDGHKTSNSLIFSEYHKSSSPANNTNGFPNKNNIQTIYPKNQTIQRYLSERDLKKKLPTTFQNTQNQNQIRTEDQYFVRTPSNNSKKTGKPVNCIDKGKHLYPKGLIKEKYQIDRLNQKNDFLKETASTQSAENLKIIQKAVPSFVRTKVVKKLGTFGVDYRNMKVSTARNNLKRENFRIISKLGQGKFGKVFMVKEIDTSFILAMKIIEKKKIIQQNLLQQFIRQLKIQSFLNHPNIISLYGFFHDETHFYTLMELGCDGQLYSLMSHNKRLNQETTSFIIKNLLEAIHYMHGNKILHRDIKPENIVLIMGSLKMCDFGWAANKLHHAELRNTFCGTPLYLSPEILNGNKYDEKVDIWAIGVLAYELMVGHSPFEINDQEDLSKIMTSEVLFPSEQELSVEFKEFILPMLRKDPNERMTSKKLLEKQFIKNYSEFETCEQLCK